MTHLDADGGRDFKDLDAHATQLALAEELGAAPEDGDSVNEEGEAGDSSETKIEWSEEDIAAHKRMAEAVLFAASEPLDVDTIASRLPAGADIEVLLEQLAVDYEERGVRLQRTDKKWRFVTAPDLSHILEIERVAPRKLSRAALETLAIIAYHQPCTRADIEDVRGVAVSKGSLDQLLEIGWVKLRGKRRDTPGRPTLYGTSEAFLEHFGLEGVADLPGLADLKAAGLLDARLPPGFSVPAPVDGEDDDIDGDDPETSEFVQDFQDDDGDEESNA
ncbi:MAG: SMC-Scp complex subunit ScpB [Pseudomonadota bacterium]